MFLLLVCFVQVLSLKCKISIEMNFKSDKNFGKRAAFYSLTLFTKSFVICFKMKLSLEILTYLFGEDWVCDIWHA